MEKYGNDKMCLQKIVFVISVVIKKNMRNQNKFVGNSQSFASPTSSTELPPRTVYVLQYTFIILESQSEKFWHQNYKLRRIKTTSYAHKFDSRY